MQTPCSRKVRLDSSQESRLQTRLISLISKPTRGFEGEGKLSDSGEEINLLGKKDFRAYSLKPQPFFAAKKHKKHSFPRRSLLKMTLTLRILRFFVAT